MKLKSLWTTLGIMPFNFSQQLLTANPYLDSLMDKTISAILYSD